MDAVEVAGLGIAYERAGSGPSLILLHGAYEDSRIWEHQLEDLSDEFTVVPWGTPGCGQSDDLTDRAGSLGEVLSGSIAALALGRKPHVLDLSFGSGLALDLWRTHLEVPATLIPDSAYTGWAGSLPPEEVERRYTQVLAELDKPAAEIIPAWLPTLLSERATESMKAKVTTIFEDFRPSGTRALLARRGGPTIGPSCPPSPSRPLEPRGHSIPAVGSAKPESREGGTMKKLRYTPSVAKNRAGALSRQRFGHFDVAFTAPATPELEEEVIEAAAERQAKASMAIEGRRVDRPLRIRSTTEARRAVAGIFETGARRDQSRRPGPDDPLL